MEPELDPGPPGSQVSFSLHSGLLLYDPDTRVLGKTWLYLLSFKFRSPVIADMVEPGRLYFFKQVS